MNFNLYFEKGNDLIKEKEYDEAEKHFKDLIMKLENLSESENNNKQSFLSEAYNSLGHILYKKVEFKEAITCFNKSIQYVKLNATTYYNRGMIYYRLGYFKLAAKDLSVAVHLYPSNIDFQTGLTECNKVISKDV